MKKIQFAISHFSLQNTPEIAQKTGNFMLVMAAIGTTILAIPDTLAAQGLVITLPSIVVTIAKGLIGLGILTKMITKCFGEIETTINGPKTN